VQHYVKLSIMKALILNIIMGGFLSLLWSCSSIDNQYLNKSIEVEKWLSEQKINSFDAEIWADEVGKEEVSLSLSSGVSGKVLFYLELYLATDNLAYLEEALIGCDYIATHLPQNVDQAKALRNSSSLYGEISGSAFVLMEAYKLTKDERWNISVNHCLSLIDSLSTNSDGRYWNSFNDVLVGSSGTGLLLLYLYKETGDPRPLRMAKEAAETLEQRAIRKQDSLYWHINQDTDMNLPNFSHGAAGVGYFFTCLYEETKDAEYLDIARQVAKYLELIAWKSDNSFLLPYGFPDYGWEREYDIGWAHGPAGTARFFFKLWQVTNEEKWLDIVKKCSNGIKLSGLPNAPNEHFGSASFPIDMRFGLGSVIDFYINLKQENILEANDSYLDELIRVLDEKAVIEDSIKRFWQIERYGFMGGNEEESATFTGYFYGSAGLGRLYILRHNLQTNNDKIRLPDDPF